MPRHFNNNLLLHLKISNHIRLMKAICCSLSDAFQIRSLFTRNLHLEKDIMLGVGRENAGFDPMDIPASKIVLVRSRIRRLANSKRRDGSIQVR